MSYKASTAEPYCASSPSSLVAMDEVGFASAELPPSRVLSPSFSNISARRPRRLSMDEENPSLVDPSLSDSFSPSSSNISTRPPSLVSMDLMRPTTVEPTPEDAF